MARKLSAYEYNQLLKYNLDPDDYLETDKPIEYITGFAEFRGNNFIVNKHTLIPRVETEELVDIAIEHLPKLTNKITFADIGTGSGAIGISFAIKLENLNLSYSGVLSDISKDALDAAKRNLNTLLPKADIELINSDLFSDFSQKKFDIIFANLPYIPSSRVLHLESSVKDYEPLVALDGGTDGLEIIRKFFNQAESFFKENGLVLLEVDDTHNNTQEFEDKWIIRTVHDQNNKNRFWIASLKKDLRN